jgi:hypothetical protein
MAINRRHSAGDEPTRQVSIALAFAASAALSTWSRLLLLRILIALAFATQLKSSWNQVLHDDWCLADRLPFQRPARRPPRVSARARFALGAGLTITAPFSVTEAFVLSAAGRTRNGKKKPSRHRTRHRSHRIVLCRYKK